MDPDLDAIAGDLATVEETLDQLAAGTYEHGDVEHPATEEPPTS